MNEKWKLDRIKELNKVEKKNNEKNGDKKCLICGAKRRNCVC